jgi:hypothetical protein
MSRLEFKVINSSGEPVMVGSLHRVAGILLLAGLILATGSRDRLSAAPILMAIYDPVDGNITMQAFENGEPAGLNIATFQFLSPLLYLSGDAALIPATASAGFTVLNTEESFVVDPPSIHAEIYATNLNIGSTPMFAGTWNLGNVAALGLSQEQIVAGFTTDPDVSPGFEPIPGHFLYQVQGNSTFFAGQITVVPEPSSVFIAVSAALVGGLWTLHRRRSQR